VNEGAFRAPFGSCFHAGQSLDQLPPGGGQSGQCVASILESLLDCLSLSDELGVKRRGDYVPTLFGLLKSKNDLAIAHSVLLHED
jgi:hypothetical protein